ncbi:MAG TPA: GNAT family N-acetyltransferase [Anaerolineales bacterium]|nr:GNAT family N-acetyltransferase [Anaerolineales bacterium]
MSPHIEPITQHNYRNAALVLGNAFADEPVSLVVYRSFTPARRAQALTVDFSAELWVALRKGYPIQISQDGKVIAAALIYPPGRYPLPLLDQWVFLFKSVLGNGWYDVRSWMKWLNEVDKLHPTYAHYYLEYIGVDPAVQGQGLGSCLMEHLVSIADREGVGCYLENASPRNLPFYQRFGFKIIYEKEIIGFPTWFMWRDPV